MRRLAPWALLMFGFGAVAAFFGWALHASGGLSGVGEEGMTLVWIILFGGVLVTGALTGFFMWLAFYSSRRGYDEQFDVNAPRGGPTGRRSWTDRVKPEE